MIAVGLLGDGVGVRALAPGSQLPRLRLKQFLEAAGERQDFCLKGRDILPNFHLSRWTDGITCSQENSRVCTDANCGYGNGWRLINPLGHTLSSMLSSVKLETFTVPTS